MFFTTNGEVDGRPRKLLSINTAKMQNHTCVIQIRQLAEKDHTGVRNRSFYPTGSFGSVLKMTQIGTPIWILSSWAYLRRIWLDSVWEW